MPFLPGNNANPNGRPRKAPDIRHEIMLEFCSKNREDIEKLGELVIEKALKDKEPWAIKLAMEMFYPKAGTTGSPPVEKNTTHNKMNVQINTLLKDLPQEDRSTLWQILNKPYPKKSDPVDVTDIQ